MKTRNAPKIVAERVALLRAEANLGQDEFAKKISEISPNDRPLRQTMVSMWETGRRSIPYYYLQPLCDYFGVTKEYLLGQTTDRHKDSPDEVEKDDTLYPITLTNLYAFDRQPVFVEFEDYYHMNEWVTKTVTINLNKIA